MIGGSLRSSNHVRNRICERASLVIFGKKSNAASPTRPPAPQRSDTCARGTRQTSRPTPAPPVGRTEGMGSGGLREGGRGREGGSTRRALGAVEGTHRSIRSDCHCPSPPQALARGYLSLCRFFTAAVWCVPGSAGAVGSFSNKPLSPKRSVYSLGVVCALSKFRGGRGGGGGDSVCRAPELCGARLGGAW